MEIGEDTEVEIDEDTDAQEADPAFNWALHFVGERLITTVLRQLVVL